MALIISMHTIAINLQEIQSKSIVSVIRMSLNIYLYHYKDHSLTGLGLQIALFAFSVLWQTHYTYCCNLPFGGRATWGSWVHLPREEGAQSRHQRLFEENVRKTGTCGLQTLIVKCSGVVFTHGEGISTPRVRHKGRKPSIKCEKYDFKPTYFPPFLFYVFSPFLMFFFLLFIGLFVFFYLFYGRQGCFPHSYVSLIAMRKSDLRSSFRTKCWLSCFYLFPQDIF